MGPQQIAEASAMTLVEMALADLVEAETFPYDALKSLRENWGAARGPLIEAFAAYASGADRSPENAERNFFGLHLLAEKRESRVFAPLVALAKEDEAFYDLLGDATTETLPGILVSLYGGDFDALKSLIEAPDAEVWARVAAFDCLIHLAAIGEIARDNARDLLRHWFETLRPKSGDPVWYGWQRAVALLGLVELEPLAARAFRQGLVPRDFFTFEDFQDDLRAARAAPDRLAFLAERGVKPIDDAIEALAIFDSEGDEAPEPERNPFRNVGRNDPCPCGSGKKYKKCCLVG